MLGKLIKYDIRSTWRDFAGIYLSILLSVIILPLLFRYVDNIVVNIVAGFAITGIVIATVVFTIIMLFRIFNANVFSKEGYLTMTLPVTSTQVVASKLLVSAMWIILTGIVSAAGVCIFIWSMAPMADVLPLFKKALSYVGGREVFAIALTVISAVASIVKEISKLFLACSVAHLKQLGRFRIPAGILSFFIISWLETLLVKVFGFVTKSIPEIGDYFNQIEFQFGMINDPGDILQFTGLYNGAMAIGILCALALTVVYSIGIIWILNHRLDLD